MDILEKLYYDKIGIYEDIRKGKVVNIYVGDNKEKLKEEWKSFCIQNGLSVFIKVYFKQNYNTIHKEGELWMYGFINKESFRRALLDLIKDDHIDGHIFNFMLMNKEHINTKAYDIKIKYIENNML